jgi:glutamate synthase (NADPH/NADH) small chain
MNSKQEKEILKMANECLNCKNPICKTGCPVKTKIPEFINQIKNKEYEKAYYILQKNNQMSYICSNTCPFEQYCQKKCIKSIKGNPVQIYKLEKFVNEWAKKNNIKYIEERKKQNNNINLR